MNISTETGYVCLNTLKKSGKESWTPAMTFRVVALSIAALLENPNPGMSTICYLYIRFSNGIGQMIHLVGITQFIVNKC